MTKAYKKYNFTAQMDEEIRRAYIERPASGAIPGVVDLSGKWSIPTWTIKRRAADLGLARAKKAIWSEQELALLEAYAHLPCAAISRKLAARWFFRTPHAVKLKLKRLKIRRSPDVDFYNVTGLADCFGVDSSVVLRWIRSGLLPVETLLTRSDGQQRRLIREGDVREFVCNNPMKFDIRKVDQLWFMDLITSGKTGFGSIEKAIRE
ncbi:MAG: hypothetical protein WA584_23605 [Pyrinomonadaceae bacterium]